ncbi:DegT/DnrJ/EryC1/StrS family aminotransferase [Polaromonas sp. YR568]|uniref:DegT/DnrJ/EryC1/StrS family aminotransferase n=1 Tax=Polaromonas sp. YR568 TaxID=1855301 RepID=UPI003137A91B
MMAKNPEIFVTRPSLSPLEEFIPYLEEIWESRIVTNGGKFHRQLENELCNHLGVEHISLFNNGTIALITALRVLSLSGEVITSPYSFIATSQSITWNNLAPVFVDIDPLTMNLDPTKVEAAITQKTTAILATHCYGIPCDVQALEKIGKQYGLKVIYDSAHAFGVQDETGSILKYGDLSVLSFHATKVFNTFEGGAIVCSSADMKALIDSTKNFGYGDELTVNKLGLNGKLSEINSAFGLVQLKYVDESIAKRKKIDSFFRQSFCYTPGITCLEYPEKVINNYSYFPILVGDDFPLSRDKLKELLAENNIIARRYFYPLISDFEYYSSLKSANPDNLPVAKQIAENILCLPIYPDLDLFNQNKIVSIICGAGDRL